MASQKTTHPFVDYILEKDPSKVKPKHKSLVEFQHDLNTELRKAFTSNLHPYKKVHVLLLCWRIADSNNYADCEEFRRFLISEFHFNIKIFQIEGTGLEPQHKSLMDEIHSLRMASDGQTLTIIGYSGHGYSSAANPNRQQRKDLVILLVLHVLLSLDEC